MNWGDRFPGLRTLWVTLASIQGQDHFQAACLTGCSASASAGTRGDASCSAASWTPPSSTSTSARRREVSSKSDAYTESLPTPCAAACIMEIFLTAIHPPRR